MKHPFSKKIVAVCVASLFYVPSVWATQIQIDDSTTEPAGVQITDKNASATGITVTIDRSTALTDRFDAAGDSFYDGTAIQYEGVNLTINDINSTKQVSAVHTYGGSAQNIHLIMTGGTIQYSSEALTGFAGGGVETANSSNVTVEVSGGTISGSLIGASRAKDADQTKVLVSGGSLKNVYGVYYSTGNVTNTTVEISGETSINVSSNSGVEIAAVSATSEGSVSNSILKISGGSIKSERPGSYSDPSPNGFIAAVTLDGSRQETMAVENARVEITGGEIDVANITGFYHQSSYAVDSLTDTGVDISGGSVTTGRISGADIYGSETNADATWVNISGGTIKTDEIYGAYSNKTAGSNPISTVKTASVTISGGDFTYTGEETDPDKQIIKVAGFVHDVAETNKSIQAESTAINLDASAHESGLDLSSLAFDKGDAKSGSANVVGHITGAHSLTNLESISIADNSSLKVNNDVVGASSITVGQQSSFETNTLSGVGDSAIDIFLADTNSGSDKAKISVGTLNANVNVTGSGLINDQAANAEAGLQSLVEQVQADPGSGTIQNLALQEGQLAGAVVGQLQDGKVTVTSEAKNTKQDAYQSLQAINAMVWRHDMNDLTKRMGELRTSPQGIGSWARVYGSEQKYGAQSLQMKATSVQVGADFDIGYGWKTGAAFSYTDGNTDYALGGADNKFYSLGLYGTWMGESGQFVDLIVKYGRISTDFNLNGYEGSYDNNALSASVEYGWHFPVGNYFFIEPQVELTYGLIMGDDFEAGQGVRVEQDDFESLIGRAGLRAGLKFPENKGTLYARLSGAYDFEGNDEYTASAAGRHIKYEADLGGGWVEFAVGANFNLTDQTYTYVDLEKTAGGEIQQNWRWNLGIRHVW